MLPEAKVELHKLSNAASTEQLELWARQEEDAQEHWVLDPSAMDVYEAEAPKCKSLITQLRLGFANPNPTQLKHFPIRRKSKQS